MNIIQRIVLVISVTMSLNGMAQSQTFSSFLLQLTSVTDSLGKSNLISEYLSHHTIPVVEGNSIHFLYRGAGHAAAVPSEINQWNSDVAQMVHVDGTNLFFRTESLPIKGRLEYKLWVDSAWMLDPLNKRFATGGYGDNSDVWMPEYVPSTAFEVNQSIPHGRIDTLRIASANLHRTHPVFVYVPSGKENKKGLPVIYVTDGNDYLTFAKMQNILDRLIASKRIRPVLALFIDPRTNLKDNSTNMRMVDYAASDTFLTFLEKELTPVIESKYPVSKKAKDRLITGVSMGGLISTYAVLRRPQFIQNCGAQSPAYVEADSAVIKLLRQLHSSDANMYIETGTINDTQEEARVVKTMLEERKIRLTYKEYPEGHNWTNWRARLGTMLEYFFPYR
jgi:enterochelin esterase family protein